MEREFVRPAIPPSTDELEVRVLEIAVMPKGEPVFSETTTRIGIDSSGTGEMVKISQEGGHTDVAKWILITPNEWSVLRDAITYMIDQCK